MSRLDVVKQRYQARLFEQELKQPAWGIVDLNDLEWLIYACTYMRNTLIQLKHHAISKNDAFLAGAVLDRMDDR